MTSQVVTEYTLIDMEVYCLREVFLACHRKGIAAIALVVMEFTVIKFKVHPGVGIDWSHINRAAISKGDYIDTMRDIAVGNL